MEFAITNTSITKFVIGAVVLLIALGTYKVIKKWKDQKRIRAVLTGVIYGGVSVGLVVFMFMINNIAEKAFDHIKESSPLSISSATYGDVIDNIDPDAKWTLMRGENEEYIVEVQLVKNTMVDEEKYRIQFCFDGLSWPEQVEKSTPFEVVFAGKINQKEASLEEVKDNMFELFATYFQNTSGGDIHPSVKEQILGSEQYSWGISKKQAADNEQSNDVEEDTTTYKEDTTTYIEETTEDSGYGFVPETVQSISYLDVYGSTLESYQEQWSFTYSLADIDGNGVKELIVSYGTCDADMNNSVYTVDEDGDAVYIGEFGGVLLFGEKSKGIGIYGVNEHMGNLHIYDITYNNFLKCEEIWSGETEEYDADYEFGADIAYYEGTDTSGLEEYVQ